MHSPVQFIFKGLILLQNLFTAIYCPTHPGRSHKKSPILVPFIPAKRAAVKQKTALAPETGPLLLRRAMESKGGISVKMELLQVPFNPVVRFSVLMGDGNNEDMIGLD